MASKLKKFKRQLLLAGLAVLFTAAVWKLSQIHSTRVASAEAKGCNKILPHFVPPMAMAYCEMVNGVLTLNIGLTGQVFDAETGHELPSK